MLREPVAVIMAALQEKLAADASPAMHLGSLLHFHRRLEHLSLDTIQKIARIRTSGIGLTDHKLVTCITCAQSKQTKNKQSLKTRSRTVRLTESEASFVQTSRVLKRQSFGFKTSIDQFY